MTTRRTFLQAAAGAGAASALPSLATAGEFTGIIKKAIKFSNVKAPQLSIEDRFKLVQDVGFDGVELRYSHANQKEEFIKARD